MTGGKRTTVLACCSLLLNWNKVHGQAKVKTEANHRIQYIISTLFVVVNPHSRIVFPLIFRKSERRGRDRREKHEYEKDIILLPPTPTLIRLGIEPATEVHGHDWN